MAILYKPLSLSKSLTFALNPKPVIPVQTGIQVFALQIQVLDDSRLPPVWE